MAQHALISRPQPLASFQAAEERIEQIKSQDPKNLHPQSHSIFLSHGKRTRFSIVWFHGYTSSPAQFAVLAKECHRIGFNVYVPRLPCHGEADPLSQATRGLKADMLARATDEAIDVAHGLGEEVTIGGLSMGGVLTAWAAQQRAVRKAVIISPALSVKNLPTSLVKPLTLVIRALPDKMRWWNKDLKDNYDKPNYQYRWHSMHGLAAILRLSFRVEAWSKKAAPQAASTWMVLNKNDKAVNFDHCQAIVQNWKKFPNASVYQHTFAQELELDHDLIDPGSPRQKIQLVYPVLMKIVTGEK